MTNKIQVRYSARIRATFPIVFAGDQFVGEGQIFDVSVPGCAVQSKKSVQAGAYLEIRVILPDDQAPLQVHLARVRWSHGKRFGVEFIRMPGHDQVRLGRLVKHAGLSDIPAAGNRWRGAHSTGDHLPQ